MATAIKKTADKMTIKDHLQSDGFKAQLAQVIPRHCKPERMARVALTALTRTPQLSDCDQLSFFQALLSLSEWGLEANGRDAHLIPFRNNKRGVTECQLIIDYKGYVKLCYQNPRVRNIHADVVYEGDDFEVNLGQVVRHTPWAFRRDAYRPAERGECIAAYARVQLDGADPKCEVMTAEDIESVRKRSRAGSSGPWVTDWAEMAKKTAFRRCVKWLPISAELTDAMDRDDDRYETLTRITDPAPAGVAALEQRIAAIQHSETEGGDADELFVQLAERLEACGSVEEVNEVEQAFVPDCPAAQLATLAEMCKSRAEQVKGAK